MHMDATKKERLEQRAVIGLIGVFLIVFATGPMKRMGWLKGGYAPAGVMGAAMNGMGTAPSGSPGHAVGHASTPSAAAAGPLSTAPALYAAQELRDPMMNVLPIPQATPEQSTAEAPMPVSEPLKPAPPALRIQGVVWGGSAPKAIIDGRIYGINDMVGTRRIVAIERGSVTVMDEESITSYSVAGLSTGSADLFSQQAQWR